MAERPDFKSAGRLLAEHGRLRSEATSERPATAGLTHSDQPDDAARATMSQQAGI